MEYTIGQKKLKYSLCLAGESKEMRFLTGNETFFNTLRNNFKLTIIMSMNATFPSRTQNKSKKLQWEL